jgi:hypothetical protein
MKIFSIDKMMAAVFGLMVFAFFAFLYPFHLNYQEQYQLFLFSADYVSSYFVKPGGLSDFLGNFLTQFYFYSWVGALLIAVLLTLLQVMVWQVSRKLGAKPVFLPFTFVPSVLFWSLLCDENYLLGGVIAMLILGVFILLCMQFITGWKRMVFLLISLPVLYWLIGGAFVLLALFVIGYELISRQLKTGQLLTLGVAALLLVVVLPLLAKRIIQQYPLSRLCIGVNYYRFPVNVPVAIGIIGLLIASLPYLLRWLSAKLRSGKAVFLIVFQLAVVAGGGLMLIRNSADMAKEEVMAYDFNVRMRKWDRVIAMAEKKKPSTPLSVTCLNLALAKMDLLGERMFAYYQNGVGGLIPDFVRDYTIPMIAGEVYYHLGFVNTAQRLAFEAMEALPDYQKSARSVMRLAETNIINGDYAVATKYLHLLQQTFYYREWATKALQTINDEKLIDQHPEWGWLRKCRTREDFLFSEKEKDMMLGILFRQNPENRMAFEYLMAYCLLSKDLQHFVEYFPLGKSLNYKAIPKSYQEALIYVWGLTHPDPIQTIPYAIGNGVKNRVRQYQRIYTGQMNAEPALRDQFADTYWYYLHFRN